MSLETFTAAYIEAALWSSTDDQGTPLDSGAHNLAPETKTKMENDCASFWAEHAPLIESNPKRAGHDFWLTRCGHGAGFWDGDWPEHGDALTIASHRFGNVDLYVGDDGKVYAI
jgi:hypothetical protein